MVTINRRNILLGTVALGAAAAISNAAWGQGALEDTLVIRSPGGPEEKLWIKHFFEPFTEKTGVRVIPVAVSRGEMLARVQAMVTAGRVEWDIILPQVTDLQTTEMQAYVADFGDCTELPNVAAVPGACLRYGVPYNRAAIALTYNTEVFTDNQPRTWQDYWDVENFPGNRGFINNGNALGPLMIALLADGVEPADMFPLDVDRAFRKFDQIKPHISVWIKSVSQGNDAFRSGAIDIGAFWNAGAFFLKQQGVPIAWSWDKAILNAASFTVMKDAPHPNAARAFLDFYMSRPEAHAAFIREGGFMTGYSPAREQLTQEEAELFGATEEIQDNLVVEDGAWLAQNKDELLMRWNAWVSS